MIREDYTKNAITINVSNIDVPYNNSKGELINYISQWDDFELPKGHSVIDKSVCGCGFTHYCLTNKDFIILVSPRVSLLENKLGQIGGCYFFKAINLTLKDKRILVQDLINQLKIVITACLSTACNLNTHLQKFCLLRSVVQGFCAS